MDILQLKEVTKEFGSRVVLDNVSFSVKEGDIFGIIGQSGSGKSTLLNMLIGFYDADEGKIMYQWDENKPPKQINGRVSRIKKKIGFATQENSFYPKLTIRENLIHFGKLYGVKKNTLINNINNLLEFTELDTYQNKLAEHLSGGMQKRLELSCSLVHKPKVLLLDEPTANLDPILQKEIIHLIRHANHQGITVIIASHHLDDIEKICNNLVLIHEGKVKFKGTVEEARKAQGEKTSLKQAFEKIIKNEKSLLFD